MLFVGGLPKLAFSFVYMIGFDCHGVRSVYFFGMWMHVIATLCWWFVVSCLWLVKACFFQLCIFDRFVLKSGAMCVHVVGMWMSMLAQLGLWNAVARLC